MNKFAKLAVVSAALALVAQAAQAAPDDIIIPFSAPGVANDYILNVGQYSAVVGAAQAASAPIDLSSSFSASSFSTAFSGAAAGSVTMAAIGGSTVGVGADSFLTQLRVGSPAANTAGSSLGGQTTVTQPALQSTANALATGLVSQGNASSWTTLQPTFVNGVGINPSAAISGTTIQEDLYQEVDAFVGSGKTRHLQGTWAYEGYFSLDTGAGTLSFTPNDVSAVPEPTTYGVLAGAGLLALSLRRQLNGKQA
jgi:PEP-CTERM motif